MTMRLLVFGLILFLSGCGGTREPGEPAPAERRPPPGVYAGTFPCANCAGIDTTLWLRSDGRFFFRQRYLDAREAELGGYNLGRWRWSAESGLVLAGAGPVRRFTLLSDGRLEMITATGLDHLLERERGAPDFVDRIRLDGRVVLEDGQLRLTECLSGLSAELRGGEDHARLRQRLRSLVGYGAPALVELEGRFMWTSTGRASALTVDRFFSIRPDGGCMPTADWTDLI